MAFCICLEMKLLHSICSKLPFPLFIAVLLFFLTISISSISCCMINDHKFSDLNNIDV